MGELARPVDGVVDAVAWVHVVDCRVLVTRTRGRDVFYLPGGKPEKGETDGEALVREIGEELNVQLDPGSLQHWWTARAQAHAYRHDTMVAMRCFTGLGSGQPKPSHEIAAIDWFTSAEMQRCAPAAQVVIQRLAREGRVI